MKDLEKTERIKDNSRYTAGRKSTRKKENIKKGERYRKIKQTD